MPVTVLSEDEYEPQEYDAVLMRERAVVGVDAEDERVRTIPLSKVNHVDADAGTIRVGTELPEWFYGGGRFGFVELDGFPELRQHIEELERETV